MLGWIIHNGVHHGEFFKSISLPPFVWLDFQLLQDPQPFFSIPPSAIIPLVDLILPVRYAMSDLHIVRAHFFQKTLFQVFLFHSSLQKPGDFILQGLTDLSHSCWTCYFQLLVGWPNMQMYWNVSAALLFFGQSHKMSCSHERINHLFVSLSFSGWTPRAIAL